MARNLIKLGLPSGFLGVWGLAAHVASLRASGNNVEELLIASSRI